MAKESKTALVPKLRFPEFRDDPEWADAKLEELITTITPPAKLPSSNYRQIGKYPIVDQSQHAICGWTDDAFAVIEDAWPLIVFGDHTCALKLIRQPFAQGADGIKIFKARAVVSTEYLFHALNHRPLVMEDYKRHFSILKERRVFYPVFVTGEQQKIADCLSSLDELIAAQGRKVEALKTYKRGLMQQLFPREGEALPRLRFPEFRDAPEWKPTTLDALVHFQSGGTPSKANPEFWNGSIPWISAKDMKRLFLDDAEDHISAAAVKEGAKVAPVGTVLILVRGMTLLKDVPICVLRCEMSFNQDVKALLPKVETEGLFVALLLLGNKQRLLKMVDIAGHGTGKLNTDELNALELSAPKPAEQRRIVDFLSSFDAQIAIEADKLAVVKAHKNGLMQQLFPAQEEA